MILPPTDLLKWLMMIHSYSWVGRFEYNDNTPGSPKMSRCSVSGSRCRVSVGLAYLSLVPRVVEE